MIANLTSETWIVIIKVFGLLIAINFITWMISRWQHSTSNLNWDYFVGSTVASGIYLISRWVIIGMFIGFPAIAFLQWYF